MTAPAGGEAELIDLLHLRRPRVIGAWLLGDVLIDPGPSSCMEELLAGLDGRVPRVIALTHIHLDHAGASGSLLRSFPDAELWVHERGAAHLIDPSRLLRSAGRLYGEQMERLWGEVLPVAPERLRVLAGGETLRGYRVAYTPGHASHHVSYLHERSGWAFTGDVAGVRIAEGPVLAPTPPPDIDLRAWRESLHVLERWRPRALAVTHFGAHADVSEHLSALRAQLDRDESLARELDEAGFVSAVRARVRESASAQTAEAYDQASAPALGYQGLARYLRPGRPSS